ncbi:MAG: EscU/YscU/HrcU family type III secretion system export apparatus switch protein [Eubacteriales bacterium]|nr:EscU/YscU/HrcU family type III secretion system export apparatus switch protein [Eubacteriales bacterium]
MKQDEKEMRKAAALKYEASTDNAPYIVAVGSGYVADRIVDEAREHNVKIVEDKKLSHVLSRLSVGDEIPEPLYQAVAEILVFISNIDKDYKTRFGLP